MAPAWNHEPLVYFYDASSLDPAKPFSFWMMNLGNSPEPKITQEKIWEHSWVRSFGVLGGKPWNDAVLVLVVLKKCNVQSGGHIATPVDTCNVSKECAHGQSAHLTSCAYYLGKLL